MFSDIEMNDFSSGMIDDEIYVKDFEADGWNGKKIHGHYVFTMIF